VRFQLAQGAAARVEVAMAEIEFRIDDQLLVRLPIDHAAQLGLHLAVFGPDDEMPRSRRMAENIAVAIDLAAQGEPASLRLGGSQRDAIAGGVSAMLDSRAGNVTDALLRLRDACLIDEHA
jgi:hypothetical protein